MSPSIMLCAVSKNRSGHREFYLKPGNGNIMKNRVLEGKKNQRQLGKEDTVNFFV